ncbi:phosphotransferase family protein [Conexibacter sp. DBS9H8]|uniref:phosphotransferase family protein n=1 Tax=Conexibacter sp. DBS9H8 TaxID=2937801 RepID=UPI00200EF908|nr:phosphotransferase family protein [Conexibacter sp. DBS9H8]
MSAPEGGRGPVAAGADPDPRLREVRSEDALDAAALGSWLTAQLPDLNAEIPEIRQFSGGASNLTYLLSFPTSGRELVLRRPPRGARSGAAHNMAREYRVQHRLGPVFPYVPTVVALCEDESVLGAPFYVMERVPGVVCGLPVPPEIGTTPEALDALGEAFISVLAQLHSVDVDAAGLADLGRGPGYVARQVAQWSDRFVKARTWNVPSFKGVMRWLEENQPDDVGTCLIHNDFRLDNMVFDRSAPLSVNAVLDWEMATVGDPLMDLGGALAYWIQDNDPFLLRRFARQPTHLPGAPRREDIIARYGDLTGRPMDGIAFYEVFGIFRLAAIIQQIYHRYSTGATTNPAFKHFWLMVRACHAEARKRISWAG